MEPGEYVRAHTVPAHRALPVEIFGISETKIFHAHDKKEREVDSAWILSGTTAIFDGLVISAPAQPASGTSDRSPGEGYPAERSFTIGIQLFGIAEFDILVGYFTGPISCDFGAGCVPAQAVKKTPAVMTAVKPMMLIIFSIVFAFLGLICLWMVNSLADRHQIICRAPGDHLCVPSWRAGVSEPWKPTLSVRGSTACARTNNLPFFRQADAFVIM